LAADVGGDGYLVGQLVNMANLTAFSDTQPVIVPQQDNLWQTGSGYQSRCRLT